MSYIAVYLIDMYMGTRKLCRRIPKCIVGMNNDKRAYYSSSLKACAILSKDGTVLGIKVATLSGGKFGIPTRVEVSRVLERRPVGEDISKMSLGVEFSSEKARKTVDQNKTRL